MRWIVLLAAVQQVLFPLFVNPFRDGPSRVQSGIPSQIEPAGYAFAIWGLIYAGALVYAGWQLTSAGRASATTRKIAPFAITLYLGSSVWLWAADSGPLWATMPILAVMAMCAATALMRAGAERSPAARWFMAAPFALYAGWTACATFVNVAEVAPLYGFDRFGLSVSEYAVLSIAAAAAAGLFILKQSRGEPLFAVTVAWALAGIIVAGVERGYDLSVLVAAATSILVIGAATGLWRRAAR